jgi:ribonuclease T2
MRQANPAAFKRVAQAAAAAQPSTDSAKPYDYYLLNLSWSPEFCVTHPERLQCALHRAFIVHGLWPQNNDGSYPQHCGDRPGPSNPEEWADVMPDTGLVKHEWETHGTCTPYDAETYFKMIRKAYGEVKPPASVTGAGPSASGKEAMMTPEAIIAAFAQANPSFPKGSIAVSCGNNRLTAVEVCMSKDLQPIACEAVRSCRANVVKITPVQ